MKKERLMGAIVLGASLGLIPSPVWSHDTQKYSGASSGEQETIGPSAGSSQERLSSREILQAEKKLDQQGFYPGEIDGVMDSRTQHAIAEFQQHKNLPVTGTIDEETSEQLKAASNSRSSDRQVGPQARLGEEEQNFRDGEPIEPHFGMYR